MSEERRRIIDAATMAANAEAKRRELAKWELELEARAKAIADLMKKNTDRAAELDRREAALARKAVTQP